MHLIPRLLFEQFFPTEQNARQKFWREWRTNFLSSDKNFCFPIADVMAVFELVAELIQDLVDVTPRLSLPHKKQTLVMFADLMTTPGLYSRGFTGEIKVYLYS